jgi:hypothetical protein
MILNNADNVKIGSRQVDTIYHQGNIVWSKNAPSTLLTQWLTTISNIGGVAPSSTVQTAATNLIGTLYNSGVLPKILRLNLFCGGDWKASFVPLVVTSGCGLAYDYNGRYAPNSVTPGNFGASDWSLTTGFNAASNSTLNNGSGNGVATIATAKIIDTTVPENYFSSLSSCHFACYISAGAASGSTLAQYTDMGVAATVTTPGGNVTQNFTLQAAYGGDTSQGSLWNSFAQGSPVLSTGDTAGGTLPGKMLAPLGMFVGSRQSKNYSVLCRDGSPIAVRTSDSINPNTNTFSTPVLGPSTICVFGRGGTGTYGGNGNKTATNLSDRGMYMYSIGTGLTVSDILIFQNAINTFNTAIGRTNYSGYGYGGTPTGGSYTFNQTLTKSLPGNSLLGVNNYIGSVINNYTAPITISISGSVDDDVTFNDVVYQPGQFVYANGLNGAHNFSNTITIPAGQSVIIGVVNNFYFGCGISATIVSTDSNASGNLVYTPYTHTPL